MQQRPREREPLALPARKVRGLFEELRLQPVLAAQEIRQIDALQHRPERAVVRAGRAHQKVFAHRALEEVALVADIGQLLHQAVLRDAAQLDAADRDRAAVRAAAPHQDRRHGRLAAAALADQRRKAALREREVYAVQDLALRRIGKAQAAAHDRAVRRAGLGLLRALGQVQQAEDLVARRHAVHRDVEEAAELPHRDEKIRRKQNDQQTARERDVPARVLRHGHDHAERRAAVGDQVHDRDRVELHRQHLHRDPAELLGLHVHLVVLEAVRLVDLQRRQPLQVLEEGVAQRGVLPPVLRKQLFRPGLHGGDRDRDQRHAHEQHDRGRHIDETEEREQRERRQHRVKELRQIRAEIRLELVDALHGHLHDLGGSDLLPVGGAEAQQLFIDLRARRLLDRFGGKMPHAGGARRTCEADRHRGHGRKRRPEEVPAVRPARKKPGQKHRDRSHHADIRKQRKPLQQDVPRYVFSALADRSDQPPVDHHKRNRLFRIFPLPVNRTAYRPRQKLVYPNQQGNKQPPPD